MIISRSLILIVIGTGVILYPGCGRKREEKILTPVRIGIQDNTTCAPIFLARARGYFAERGIEAEIIRYPTGKLAFQAMLEGQVDISTASGAVIAARAFERMDFSVIATLATIENGAWIIGRRDHGIEKPSDLKGKTIATQRNSAVHFFLSRFLIWNRIPASSVTLRFMNGPDLPAALIRGEIDAFSMRNPFIAQAREALGDAAIELYSPEAYRQNFNLVVMNNYLARERKAVTGVLAALDSAVGMIYGEPDAAREMAGKELGPDRREEVIADWDRNHFSLRLDQDLLSLLDSQGRWQLENSENPSAEIPNYLKLIDPAPLNSVSSDSCTIIGAGGE